MTRLKGVEDAEAGLTTRFVYQGAKRKAGRVPDPLRIMAHSRSVMWSAGLFETAHQRGSAVPERLKGLASIKAAAMIGCVF